MLKKSLFAVALVALLASMAPAGEIKLDGWPTGGFIPLEITKIPVVMDIGYWVFIPDQDKLRIKLHQTAVDQGVSHTFEGNTDMKVRANFDLKLATSIASAGVISGDWSSWVTPDTVSAGEHTVKVYAKLTNAKVPTGLQAGSKDVQVATVTVTVVPN
jgi:hypothetical protein